MSEASICIGCGFCCDGTLFRSAALNDSDDVVGLAAAGVALYPRTSGGLSLRQPCGALHQASCTAYEIRPHACRRYRCVVLEQTEAGGLAVDEARALIAAVRELRDEVGPRLEPLLDTEGRRMLDGVYRNLLRRFEPSSAFAASVSYRSEPAVDLDAGAGDGSEVADVLPLNDLAWRWDASMAGIGSLAESMANAPTALLTAQSVVDMRQQARGPDHRDTFDAQELVATLTGLAGRPLDALELHRELAEARARVLGEVDADTLGSRQQLADWTGVCGEPEEALALHRRVLADRVAVLGPDHPSTLNTRHSVAYWTGVCGDPTRALEAHEALLADRLRVQGPDHVDTLTARYCVAVWKHRTGSRVSALEEMTVLLLDRLRRYGPDEPGTQQASRAVAVWSRLGSGADGDRSELGHEPAL